MSASRIKRNQRGWFNEPLAKLVFAWCPTCGFFRKIIVSDEVTRIGPHIDEYGQRCIHHMTPVYYHPEMTDQ